MTLRILNTWIPSDREWDDIWYNCPYSTFFHSREWAEIWEVYGKGTIAPDPLGISLSNGTKIVLPISKQKLLKGLVMGHISSPAGTFGGWLALIIKDRIDALNDLPHPSLL